MEVQNFQDTLKINQPLKIKKIYIHTALQNLLTFFWFTCLPRDLRVVLNILAPSVTS